MMMIIAGISLIIGAISVVFIREHKPEDDTVEEVEKAIAATETTAM